MLGPLEGYLIDRLGSRLMILIGYTIMGVGFLLFSQIQNLWQFYAAYLVVSLGSGLGGWLAVISLINKWFIRRRSFAMAATMSGIHFGGFLVPVLALGLETHGFRNTNAGIGVFMLATVLPMAWFVVRNTPEGYGMRPDGDLPRPATQPAGAAAGMKGRRRAGLHRAPGNGDARLLDTRNRPSLFDRLHRNPVHPPWCRSSRTWE